MLLYLIRHGQSVRNVKPEGPHDCELTDLGREQARRVAEYLADKGVERLYTSPAIRALMTARPIAEKLGLRPKVWTELVEWGYLFEDPGLTRSEFIRSYPEFELDDEIVDGRGWAEHITQESWSELYERTKRVRDVLLNRYGVGGPSVALVTHNHFAGFFIGALFGIDRPDEWDGLFQHYNCGVTCIKFGNESPEIWYTNAHAHLGDLLTW